MGGCCCKAEPQLSPPVSQPVADPGADLAECKSILSLQEAELNAQLATSAHLAKELAALQGKTRAADHVLLTSAEKQFTLKAAFELEEQNRELQRLSTLLSKAQEDCKTVKADLEGPTPQVDTCKRNLEALHNDLTHTHKNLHTVEEKLAGIKKAYEDEESARLSRIQQRSNRLEASLRIPAHWIQDHLRRFWTVWRTKPPVPVVMQVESEGTVATPSPPETKEIKETDLHAFLLAEFQAARSRSPFAELDEDSELSEDVLAKLLTESLTARAAGEARDIAFPLFFQTFLAGVTPQVSRGAVAHTLRLLDAAGRRTSQVLGSLLHIGSGYPIFAQWSYRISAIFGAMSDILEKKGRLKGETELPLETRVGLAEVLGFVYAHLKDSPQTGEELIRLLRPQTVRQADYSLFVLSHKMSEKHVESLGLFRRVDVAGKGRIQMGQFVRGVQEVLGVWLSSEDLFGLVKGLAKGDSDELSRVEFLKLNLKTYLNNAGSDLYTVSLLELLAVLHQAFVLHSQHLTTALMETLGNDAVLDELDFAVRVRELCGDQSASDIAGMWREVSELKLTGASNLEAAVRVLLRHEIGPVSVR